MINTTKVILVTILLFVGAAVAQASDSTQSNLNQPTFEVLKAGDGTNFPTAGQKVTAHYRGNLTCSSSILSRSKLFSLIFTFFNP